MTRQQFDALAERLRRPRRAASPVFDNSPVRTSLRNQIILGVDPSLRGTGYGVLQQGKPHPRALAHGTIRCPESWNRSRCLMRISEELRAVAEKYRPQVCAIEGLFFAQNLRTALIMGEARGAALAALAGAGLEIYEIAPRKVKQAVVGYGAAQKLAVAKMVQRMLHLTELPAPDAADALAIAIALGMETSRYSLSPPKRL